MCCSPWGCKESNTTERLNWTEPNWYLLATPHLNHCYKFPQQILPGREWHPTPVLLPGKSHGRRSLVGCSPWGREESDTTEQLRFNFSLACIGEGNGNPLQCSCIENPRDREAWWPAIYGVTQSRPQLKRLSCSSSMLKSTNLTWTNHDIEIWLKPHLCVIPKSIVFLTPRWLYMKDSCLPQYASYSSTNVETPVLVITLIIGENTVRSESIF